MQDKAIPVGNNVENQSSAPEKGSEVHEQFLVPVAVKRQRVEPEKVTMQQFQELQ